jgi:hypothetical protein
MSRFMETQVTGLETWYELDGDNGRTFVPADDVPELRPVGADDCSDEADAARKAAGTYYDGRRVYSVREIQGYGVRESAPGYMDCTEWEVYPSESEADARGAEIDAEYGDDETDDA